MFSSGTVAAKTKRCGNNLDLAARSELQPTSRKTHLEQNSKVSKNKNI